MKITLTEEESVVRNGDSYSIGNKVYGSDKAPFGVGYIQEIELYGVHFGFRAKISSITLDSARWVDSRNLSKEMPQWAKEYKSKETENTKPVPNNNALLAE